MVLEHDFVTTMPEEAAMAAIRHVMIDLGFRLREDPDGERFERHFQASGTAKEKPSDMTAKFEFDRDGAVIGREAGDVGLADQARRNGLQQSAVVDEVDPVVDLALAGHRGPGQEGIGRGIGIDGADRVDQAGGGELERRGPRDLGVEVRRLVQVAGEE